MTVYALLWTDCLPMVELFASPEARLRRTEELGLDTYTLATVGITP
jgi:hypothetical protein